MGNEIVLEDALELLGDSYARTVLAALTEDPRSAPELADRCEFSRVTVYRRLADLEAAGLVRAEVELSTSGHHRQIYYNVLEQLTVSMRANGMDGEVSVGDR